MTNKTKMAALVAAVGCTVALAACQNKTTEPSKIVITNNNTNSNTNTGGGTNPGPGGSSGCQVAVLRGGIYGDNASVACTGRVSNELKVGCTVHFTVTPKRPDGTDASPLEHGQNLSLTESAGQDNASFSPEPDNPFNFSIRGDKAGFYQLKAVLVAPNCPVPFERTYDYTVAP